MKRGIAKRVGRIISGSLADQLVNSALKYRAQAPLIDSLLKEVGIKGGDINGMANIADRE